MTSIFGPGSLSPLDFGPAGTGGDDTPYFQQCIAAITGPADPATHSRVCTAKMRLPAGTYRVNEDVLPRSVIGFHLEGDGPDATTIALSGTNFAQAGLYVDGSLDAVVEGLTLEGDGTEQVPNGLLVDWSLNAARSTSANCFRDIRVRGLKCNTGFSLAGTGTRQLDGTDMSNIYVAGGRFSNWAADTTGVWGTGFDFGNGSWGNNYNHAGRNLNAAGWNIGYKINLSSLKLDGAEPSANGIDFWIQPAAQISLENIQSQGSGQFIQHSATYPPAPIGIRDCEFVTAQATTPNWISIHGGKWHLDNVTAEIFDPNLQDYITPVILCGGNQGAIRPSVVTIDNYTAYGAMTAAIRPMANSTRVAVRNYGNFYTKTGQYAPVQPGDMEAFYTGSSWNLAV
jgi:hypothetical protein